MSSIYSEPMIDIDHPASLPSPLPGMPEQRSLTSRKFVTRNYSDISKGRVTVSSYSNSQTARQSARSNRNANVTSSASKISSSTSTTYSDEMDVDNGEWNDEGPADMEIAAQVLDGTALLPVSHAGGEYEDVEDLLRSSNPTPNRSIKSMDDEEFLRTNLK
jgi:hypothetical protein